MGLFGKKDRRAEYIAKYKKYEKRDCTDEEYYQFIDKVRKTVNGAYPEESRYILSAFITSISNTFVCFLLELSFGSLKGLLEAWCVDEALKPNNVFRRIINNSRFVEEHDRHFYDGIYESYVQCLFDEELADDNHSVIYNTTLYRFEYPTIKKICDYDYMLKQKHPEYRMKVLYSDENNENSFVRELYEIESKMKEFNIND